MLNKIMPLKNECINDISMDIPIQKADLPGHQVVVSVKIYIVETTGPQTLKNTVVNNV